MKSLGPFLAVCVLAACASAPPIAGSPDEAEAPPSAGPVTEAAAGDIAPSRTPAARRCMPLPAMPANATPLQRQLYTETLIALYVLCASGPL